jgi:hypothetical protein
MTVDPGEWLRREEARDTYRLWRELNAKSREIEAELARLEDEFAELGHDVDSPPEWINDEN